MSPYSSSSSSSTSLMYTWRSRIIDVHVSQKRCIQAARRQSERRSRGPGAQQQVQSRGVAKRITQFPTAVALAANDADAADAVAGTPVVAHHRPLAASGRLLPLALHRPPFCASSALPLSSSSSSSSPSKRLDQSLVVIIVVVVVLVAAALVPCAWGRHLQRLYHLAPNHAAVRVARADRGVLDVGGTLRDAIQNIHNDQVHRNEKKIRRTRE